MTQLGDPAAQREIRERIQKLHPSSRAVWGKMNVKQMLCHLNDAFLVPLGDKDTARIPMNPLQRSVMKWGALYVPMRWPRNLKSTPEIAQGQGGTPPVGFESDRDKVLRTIERFCDPASPLDGREHPFFLTLTRAQWLRWGYLHTDHHLRQFGA